VATAECREPAGSDRLPVHRSESPTGYSSAGCSPAEPASASPVSENISSIPIRPGNQMRCSTAARMSPRVWVWRPRPPCPPPTRVSSLLCAPGVISILRRQRQPGGKRRCSKLAARPQSRVVSGSKIGFASDSPLEGDGFEPSVPRLRGAWYTPARDVAPFSPMVSAAR